MPPMELPGALRGRDIVCVGFADWDTELWTNQHHLMARLAQSNRILFVESLGLRRPQLAGRDLRRIARRLRTGLQGPRAAAPGGAGLLDSPDEGGQLSVLSPLVVPLHGNAAAEALNRRLLPALVSRAVRRLGMHDPWLWSYVPQAEVLLDALRPSLVVYHCVDDISAHERIDTASFRAAEERFAGRADLVLASAPELVRRMRTISGNVIEAPNVADTELFATALDATGETDPAVAALPSPRLLFTGAISAVKLDIALLVELARARRDWTLALVGPVGLGDPTTDVSALAAEPNVHLLGPRRYEQLPAVLRGADAGLIPYVRSELTDSIFPMKVYEYLAAGLPVVATPLPALAGLEQVACEPDATSFRATLERELSQDSPARRAARSAAAASHSWEQRLREIAIAIEALPPR
jgi:glycosyltransferase involved in cell wall biosynthesis